jgi:anti-sigma-K factor RskA
MQHEEHKELLALEAIGALTPEEAQAFAAHLATCEECRRESEELREAAATLAYTVEQVAPSAAVRSRVLESARSADTVLPFKRPARDEKNGDGERARQPATRDESPARVGAWRLVASRPSLMFGAVAAALIIAALAGLSVVLWSKNRELTLEMARLSQNLSRAQGELMLARDASVRATEIKDIITAPDAFVTALDGTNDAPGASARLVVDKGTNRAVLAAHGLPPAPAGKAYQLWYIAGGKPQPGGVFKTDATGGAVLNDRVPDAGHDASLFAVTLEPEGGAQAPTGGIYLRGAAS